ncbi:MAG: cyclic nucleotide-binding domain-containing protein [Polyangia bacterium]|jgi:CRP-like cAMP-binding protein|nr:cyclic nucleotide-binding domain-containing protein [Polyangia bacterium]
MTERFGKRNLEALLGGARLETATAGSVIIQDQGRTDRLFLVVEGVCRVSMESGGRALLLGRQGKGQWLGELSLLTGEPATSSVTAETDVRLFVWPHEEIQRLRQASPEVAGAVARELIEALTERVRASDSELQHGEGELSLKGSEEVKAKNEAPRKGWLKRVLGKLSGASDQDGAPSQPSPRKEGDQ